MKNIYQRGRKMSIHVSFADLVKDKLNKSKLEKCRDYEKSIFKKRRIVYEV